MAFVLGEVIAIYAQAALLFVTVLLVLLSFILLLFKNREQKIEKVMLMILSLCFMVVGYLITEGELSKKKSIDEINGQTIVVNGEILQITDTKYGFRYKIKTTIENLAGNNKRNLKKIKDVNLIFETKEELSVSIGNNVKCRGIINRFDKARNKGNFDSDKYYQSLGIYGEIANCSVEITSNETNLIKQRLYDLKKSYTRQLKKICNDNNIGVFKICNLENGGIIQGILLGNKNDINDDIKSLYQMNGISHILAISGLHISLIGLFVYSLIRKKLKFIPAAFFSISIILLFSMMTGFGVATVRATIMFIMNIAGEVLGRKNDRINAIALAFLLIVCSNPMVIINSGFQMSFAAIIGANFVWKITEKFMDIKGKRWSAFGFSLCITIVMNPIIAWNYYQIPMYSVLLNLIIVPLMGIVIASGFVGLYSSYLFVIIGKITILPACLIIKLYGLLCTIVEHIPFYNMICGKPNVIVVIVYYFTIAGMCIVMKIYLKKNEDKESKKIIPKTGQIVENERSKKAKKRKIFIKKITFVFGSFIIITISLFVHIFTGIEVNFLDVGQGDGIVIQTKNIVMTVDGGSTDIKNVGKYRIIPFIKYKGIKRIDYAIISHLDNDHVSGVRELLEQSDNGGIKVRNIVLPKLLNKDDEYVEMEKLAHAMGVEVLYLKNGDSIEAGPLKIKCINPDIKNQMDDRNDNSTVLDVKYKNFSMLLTGDISSEVENNIEKNLAQKYTVLKVPHHGSRFSSSEKLLSKVSPKYSVISCGEGNSYGHPHVEAIRRLEKYNTEILRTDLIGEIDFRIE